MSELTRRIRGGCDVKEARRKGKRTQESRQGVEKAKAEK